MNYRDLINKTERFIHIFFTKYATTHFTYHNLDHTLEVVRRVKEIGAFYSPDPKDMFVLETAAWFHDTGYLLRGAKGHEEQSVAILKEYSGELTIPCHLLEPVSKVILATNTATEPVSMLDKIIRDADTYHFGTPLFRKTDALVRYEIESLSGKTFDNWINSSIRLLLGHHYYTNYCREKLDEGKKQNIAWLESQK